jgi:hypothetical protein
MDNVNDVRHTDDSEQTARDGIPALPLDESRLVMMRRVKAMTVAERLNLFEQLSTDAASLLRAKRVR